MKIHLAASARSEFEIRVVELWDDADPPEYGVAHGCYAGAGAFVVPATHEGARALGDAMTFLANEQDDLAEFHAAALPGEKRFARAARSGFTTAAESAYAAARSLP